MDLVFLAGRTLLFRRGSFAMLLAAVAGAVGLQIANGANLEGYAREMFRLGIENIFGHVVVSAPGAEPFADPEGPVARLRALDGVAAVAPRFSQPGVLFHRGRRHPVSALGVEPEAEDRATRFCGRLAAGACPRAGEVVVGGRIAEKLALAVGDQVTLALPVEDLDDLRMVRSRFRVAGVLGPSGGFSLVEYAVYLRIEDLCAALDWKSAATAIQIHLADAALAPALAPRIQEALGPKLRVQTWNEVNGDVRAMIDGMATLNRISQVMVVLAVLIPTFALHWINVLRERRQIAALSAIGFSGRALFATYLLRASLVGLIGAAIGSAVGLLLCRWFLGHPLYEAYGFAVRPVLTADSVLVSVGLVFAVSVAGGLAPALRAARANPALALREA